MFAAWFQIQNSIHSNHWSNCIALRRSLLLLKPYTVPTKRKIWQILVDLRLTLSRPKLWRILSSSVGAWCSGIILRLGRSGRGFDSLSSPKVSLFRFFEFGGRFTFNWRDCLTWLGLVWFGLQLHYVWCPLWWRFGFEYNRPEPIWVGLFHSMDCVSIMSLHPTHRDIAL